VKRTFLLSDFLFGLSSDSARCILQRAGLAIAQAGEGH
jgi:hypothetical protein